MKKGNGLFILAKVGGEFSLIALFAEIVWDMLETA